MGNIPYGQSWTGQWAQLTPTQLEFIANCSALGLSEEQITDIFSSAGKVERFRLVYDSETGRPKGFGFADYPDTGSTAPSNTFTNRHDIANHILSQTLLPRPSAT